MQKILCFGELLLRFSPRLQGEWIRKNTMPVYVGGAELNVARALALWDLRVSYLTTLPETYLSNELISYLQKEGINTDKIVFGGNKIGTYYLPQGADLKNAGVIYDRAHSSFWELRPGQIDWNAIFEDVGWFHFSAISPALNQNTALICKEAVEFAKKKGVRISCDLNYRAKLWQYGKDPKLVMPDLVQYCDLLMGNIWSAASLLGTYLDPHIHEKRSKQAYLDHGGKSAEQIRHNFPNCVAVAQTFRFGEQENLRYYASLETGEGRFVSHEYQTQHVVDRVGSGDSFMAGLIYGYSTSLSAQEIIHFAAAAGFAKLFIEGDAIAATREEIKMKYQNYGEEKISN